MKVLINLLLVTARAVLRSAVLMYMNSSDENASIESSKDFSVHIILFQHLLLLKVLVF